ncbi:MAG: UMP kinase [Chloroflexota bacterium]|nr:UMP kinase [Chloroflexota bacterium]
MAQAAYQRVLLKLGGEALAGPEGYGIDPQRAEKVAAKIGNVLKHEVQVAIVIGAGNIWRGTDGLAHGMDRATADQMGMLATVMNSLALRDALERAGVTVRVHTAIEMKTIAEPYIRLRAIHQLDKGYVVIIGAGTGNPYFTTDTAAALRAMEISADILIKATKVDGVYSKDPHLNPQAERFDKLSYIKALNMQVKVMDGTAITLCMDNDLPILVVDLWEPHSLERAVVGEKIGSIITS